MKNNIFPGKLVVFCGVDGSGKSTLISYVTDYLNEIGKLFTVIKMPSDRIRKMDIFKNYHISHDEDARKNVDSLALTVLVSGDRMISLEQDIIPRLKAGEVVICDRYVFSGLACADGLIVRSILTEFIEPDIAFLATASPTVVKCRVKSRPEEKNDYYDDFEAERKIKKFESIASEFNFFKVINTEDNFLANRQVVVESIKKLISVDSQIGSIDTV